MLKGENFRKISRKIHSSQIRLASCLRRKSFACLLAGWIREYTATFVVALCVLLVALINFSSGSSGTGSIFDTLAGNDTPANPIKNRLASEASKKNNLATAPLLSLSTPAPSENDVSLADQNYYADDSYAMYQPEPTINNQIVFASIGPQAPTAKEKRGTRTYEVKMGDTAGSIAAAYGVSTSTILSANNLSDTSLLKPGDKLAILPVTGASYKVQKGDSLEVIGKKYNVDSQKIIAYNELTADGKLKEGQALTIPDGYLSPTGVPAQASGLAATGQTQTPTSGATAFAPIRLGGGGSGHRFPYGYCTWYVAQRRYVPWGGNAGTWLAGARASGKATGSMPRPGAIMVSGESRWGHVALVESVSGSSFTVSEMNYAGFGRKSTRTLSTRSGVVKGFIY